MSTMSTKIHSATEKNKDALSFVDFQEWLHAETADIRAGITRNLPKPRVNIWAHHHGPPDLSDWPKIKPVSTVKDTHINTTFWLSLSLPDRKLYAFWLWMRQKWVSGYFKDRRLSVIARQLNLPQASLGRYVRRMKARGWAVRDGDGLRLIAPTRKVGSKRRSRREGWIRIKVDADWGISRNNITEQVHHYLLRKKQTARNMAAYRDKMRSDEAVNCGRFYLAEEWRMSPSSARRVLTSMRAQGRVSVERVKREYLGKCLEPPDERGNCEYSVWSERRAAYLHFAQGANQVVVEHKHARIAA